MTYKFNPKTENSGMITCIPQEGICSQMCKDCYFQSGRSYLEPLEDNLPNIPSKEQAKGRIVRMNDGNDSNLNRDLVIQVALTFDDFFFNTSINRELSTFPGPVVLTLNPAKMTDKEWYKIENTPKNLMHVRIRSNLWNIEDVIKPAIDYYTRKEIPIILTFMRYYHININEKYKKYYIWKKKILNSYWCLRSEEENKVMTLFTDNSFVYKCGYKNDYRCSRCGNCIREYYNTKERLR